MNLMEEIIIPSHHWIRFSILYLLKWRVNVGYHWFGFNLLFFFFFSLFFPSLSSSYWVLAMQKNYIIPSISFSFDLVLLLLIIIILFALIIFNWILFQFHPQWFDFVNFFFNLVFIILIDIFLVLNHFID